jgi:regulatory protein
MASTEPLPPLDPRAQATYDRALDLLTFRARSAKQLEKRLLEKGEPEDAVGLVIARLLANGLLDDARFAASRARSGIVGKDRSRRRMSETLARDGVSREVADAAIREVVQEDGGDELSAALRAAKKKLRSIVRADSTTRRDKLYGFLARQGYGPDVVRRTLREVLDATPPEGAEEAE